MRTLRLMAVAVLLTPAVGCSWMRENLGMGEAKPKATTKLEPVTPDQLVSYLNDRAARLQSLSYGEMRLKCEDRGTPIPMLRGDLAAAQPRNFRLVGQTGIGGGKIDLGSNPEQFWVYVNDPTAKQPLYVFAAHSDFEAGRAKLPGGIPFEPDWVMQALGMVTFSPTNPYETVTVDSKPGSRGPIMSVPTNDKDRTYILSWPTTTPTGIQVVKEVVFDADAATGNRPQVKRHVMRDAKTKKVLASADVLSAKSVQAGTDPRSGLPTAIQYPTHVVLKWEEQKFRMDLTLDQAKVNPPVAEDQARRLFTRPEIRGANPVDLAKYEFR